MPQMSQMDGRAAVFVEITDEELRDLHDGHDLRVETPNGDIVFCSWRDLELRDDVPTPIVPHSTIERLNNGQACIWRSAAEDFVIVARMADAPGREPNETLPLS